MREAGAVVAAALSAAEQAVRPGCTTADIDQAVERTIRDMGAQPSFKGYRDYPAAACVSVNHEVVHGIPGGKRIQEGDIVSVDVGACLHGMHGDAARTFAVGKASDEAMRLIEVTKQAFYAGMRAARAGNRVGDISAAVQQCAESAGFSVVRQLTGHGIGKHIHEAPDIPNFGRAGRGMRLSAGMTLAVEPMINMGKADVLFLDDHWTVITADGSLSAHYENTLLVRDGDAEILTAPL